MEKKCAMCMKELSVDEINPCLLCVCKEPRHHYPLWCNNCYLLHLKFHGQKGCEFIQSLGEKEIFDAVALQETLREGEGNTIGVL